MRASGIRYAGFVLIMTGFLLQWPTLITLVMFPILVYVYVRLARREERESLAQFGDVYRRYMAATPAFSRASARRRFGLNRELAQSCQRATGHKGRPGGRRCQLALCC